MSDSTRGMYFARTVVYGRREEDVVLIDMHDGTSTQPMEPWLGRVYLLADGTHTVQQLIDFVSAQYAGRLPPNLDRTIDSVIQRLHESKVIELSTDPVSLPYYLSLPAEELDKERANQLMVEDGFQQCELPRGISKPPGKKLNRRWNR